MPSFLLRASCRFQPRAFTCLSLSICSAIINVYDGIMPRPSNYRCGCRSHDTERSALRKKRVQRFVVTRYGEHVLAESLCRSPTSNVFSPNKINSYHLYYLTSLFTPNISITRKQIFSTSSRLYWTGCSSYLDACQLEKPALSRPDSRLWVQNHREEER